VVDHAGNFVADLAIPVCRNGAALCDLDESALRLGLLWVVVEEGRPGSTDALPRKQENSGK